MCRYLDIEADDHIYFRFSSFSIVDVLDAVQSLLPHPGLKAIDDMNKEKTCKILNEIYNAASTSLKDNMDKVFIKEEDFQNLFHCCVEDILLTEFFFDFEKFKTTVLSFSILSD